LITLLIDYYAMLTLLTPLITPYIRRHDATLFSIRQLAFIAADAISLMMPLLIIIDYFDISMPFPFTICRLRRSPRFCQRTFT
jgi:hypothetical protein